VPVTEVDEAIVREMMGQTGGGEQAPEAAPQSGETVVIKRYAFAGQVIAMRRNGVLYWLRADHLGSASLVLNANGKWLADQRFYPYGETKRSDGASVSYPTDRLFTGMALYASLGIYHMGARWYDSYLARWLSPDTIVPNPADPQSLNRYTWVLNNPLRLMDPTGHQGVPWWEALRTAAENAAPSVKSWISSKSEAFAADLQALSLAVEWLTETGPQDQAFGPNAPLTQDIRHDPQIDEFCEQWAAAGHPLPFSKPTSIDTRNGPLISGIAGGVAAYARENAELGLALLGLGSNSFEGRVDAVGGILGSFDKVTVSDAGDGLVKIEVVNKMTWKSATRIPGRNRSLLYETERGTVGLGGNVEQYFYWWDSVYADDSCY